MEWRSIYKFIGKNKMKTLDNCAFPASRLCFELENVILLLRPSLLTINAFC